MKRQHKHRGPSARERIHWLLGFLQRDVAALRTGALHDTWEDYQRHVFLGEPGDDTFPAIADTAGEAPGFVETASLQELAGLAEAHRLPLQWIQDTLRAGLTALHAGKDWSPFSITGPSVTVTYRPSGGALVRRYLSDDVNLLAVAQAADLLVEFWPQLRLCKRRGCGVFFIPSHGLQTFHDPKCSDVVRKKKFAAKPRDHKVEMIRRQELANIRAAAANDKAKNAKTGRKR
jgi:hypothetical protein